MPEALHQLDVKAVVHGLREGRLVYQGSREDIRRMTDSEFKDIYGEEAERAGGISGDISPGENGG